MKFENSSFNNEIIHTCKNKIGVFHFCKNVIVSEINEGIHFDYELAKKYIINAKSFFGNKPIGYISNRINDISINALDYGKFKKEVENLIFYSVVRYNNIYSFNVHVEERFCNIPYKSFENLEQSYLFVNNYIIEKTNR